MACLSGLVPGQIIVMRDHRLQGLYLGHQQMKETRQIKEEDYVFIVLHICGNKGWVKIGLKGGLGKDRVKRRVG